MFDMPEEIALGKFGVDMETLRAAMRPAPNKYQSWSFYPIREEVKDNDIQTTVYCEQPKAKTLGLPASTSPAQTTKAVQVLQSVHRR